MSAILLLLKNKALIASIILLVACNNKPDKALPYYNKPDLTPVWIANKTAALKKIDHHIGEFSFIDQEGTIITQDTVKGKIHVANFIFTTCAGICPRLTTNFKTPQQAFADNKDVLLLSYSVAPWIDSVPRLKKYADKYGVLSDKWHLLTGPASAIYTLARQSYFAEENTGFSKDSTDFLHTEHFILVDRQSRIRGVYNGTLTLETQRLTEDIHLLLREE